jgi:uncharacterized membrane protein
MLWIMLSISSAVFESLKDACGKISTQKSDPHTSAFSLHLVTFIASTFWLLFNGVPQLAPSFWWGTLAFLPLTPLWTYLYLKALREAPLSTTLPLMATNPIFTLIIANLLRGTTPSNGGVIGVILISLGIYIANLKTGKGTSLLTPFITIIHNPGARSMLAVAFLWSLGAIFSQWKVQGSNAWFSTWASAVVGLLTTVIVAKYSHFTISFQSLLRLQPSQWSMSGFYFLANLASSLALQTAPTEYVHAIKRSSIIGSSVLGFTWFKETINLAKVIGLVVLAAGVVMITLGA